MYEKLLTEWQAQSRLKNLKEEKLKFVKPLSQLIFNFEIISLQMKILL